MLSFSIGFPYLFISMFFFFLIPCFIRFHSFFSISFFYFTDFVEDVDFNSAWIMSEWFTKYSCVFNKRQSGIKNHLMLFFSSYSILRISVIFFSSALLILLRFFCLHIFFLLCVLPFTQVHYVFIPYGRLQWHDWANLNGFDGCICFTFSLLKMPRSHAYNDQFKHIICIFITISSPCSSIYVFIFCCSSLSVVALPLHLF